MTQPANPPPTLAVWKFASCDGCQLTLLDCEDELLTLASRVRFASFTEASSAVLPGPYDLSLVEGSITTAHDAERIHQVREQSRFLVTIGACATAGGIQALRNFADVTEFRAAVYASPQYIDTLATSTPISAHVPVDFELRGCPIDKGQLLELITALLAGRKPDIPDASVCTECKRRGLTCVMVADGTPCLGPGHPGRLRRAVPGRAARLLRLLRAGDRCQRARPDPAPAPLRDAAGQGRPGPVHLQRRRPGLRRGPPGKGAR